MSLITQCPACDTLFKVVPDQLRISDGWVRCGQCDEVFDANANIYSEPAQVSAPLAPEAPQNTPAEPDWKTSLQFAAESVPEDMSDSLASVDATEFTDVIDVLEVDSQRPEERTATKALNIADAQESLDALLDLRPGHSQDAPVQAFLGADIGASTPAPLPEPRYAQAKVKTLAPDDNPKVSFMRPVRGHSVWQRGAVRVLLSVFAFVLLAGLLLQVVLHERDRLAATDPVARESLVTLCDWLDCKVHAVRQIESIVIDSSSFTKVRADVYRLNFTLKSTAAIGLAMPALELTLTDMQDQAVVRKVLRASELAAGKEILEPGAELSAAMPLSLKQGNGSERVSGYRLLAFYP